MTNKQRLQIFTAAVLAIAVLGSAAIAFIYLFAPHQLPNWLSRTASAPVEAATPVPATTSEPEIVASPEPATEPEPAPATPSSESAMLVEGRRPRGGSAEPKLGGAELSSGERPMVIEPSSEENKEESSAVKSQVLARIDLMPHLSAGNRTKLSRAVDRAKSMRKLMVVSFDPSQTVLSAPAAAELVEFIGEKRRAEWERLLKNPVTVFVVLGYADTTGDAGLNLRISTARAENLVKVLHNQARIKSTMHAVGMGESEMFGREQLAKNRIVEVWAVIP